MPSPQLATLTPWNPLVQIHRGEDGSPVVPSVRPKTMSDEDSFKRGSIRSRQQVHHWLTTGLCLAYVPGPHAGQAFPLYSVLSNRLVVAKMRPRQVVLAFLSSYKPHVSTGLPGPIKARRVDSRGWLSLQSVFGDTHTHEQTSPTASLVPASPYETAFAMPYAR